MENAVVIAADTFIVERKYYICVDFNNAIKVPDTIDEMPNSGNEVPDKTETVPNTMKRMPDSGNEVPDTTVLRACFLQDLHSLIMTSAELMIC